MPFWHHETEEERQQKLAAQEEQRQEQLAAQQAREADRQTQAREAQLQQQSIAELEQGNLPLRAQQRLRQFHDDPHHMFTSDLSVNEFLLAREQGFESVGQVMGASIYHMGWQYQSYYQSAELDVISQAYQHAAQLALGRLQQEAAGLHAHGVIGVRLTTDMYEWGQDLLEFKAIGTAVRLKDAPVEGTPFLSDLSGQEFWALIQSGHYPIGLVTGYCSYAVIGNWGTQWQSMSWFNQELTQFTEGVYTARHLAMRRLHDQARSMGAAGVVGMHIDQNQREIEYETKDSYGNDITIKGLIAHFSAVGTAISGERSTWKVPAPQMVFDYTEPALEAEELQLE